MNSYFDFLNACERVGIDDPEGFANRAVDSYNAGATGVGCLDGLDDFRLPEILIQLIDEGHR